MRPRGNAAPAHPPGLSFSRLADLQSDDVGMPTDDVTQSHRPWSVCGILTYGHLKILRAGCERRTLQPKEKHAVTRHSGRRRLSEVVFHLLDRPGDGASIMPLRGLQIPSPNEFGDHLTGSLRDGKLNDLVHGLKVQVTGRLRRAGQLSDEVMPRSVLPASPWLEHCHSLE
jgi:hypothetical protein